MALTDRANNADSLVRAGFENPCLAPANPADAVWQAACLVSSDVAATNLSVENPGISRTAKAPFAGQQEAGGTVTWVAGPGELLPLVSNAFVRHDATVDLGGGAFRTRMGREEVAAQPDTYTYYQDEGDDLPLRFVGSATETLDLALEDGAPQWAATILATYATPWEQGAFFPLAGGTGRIELRGGPLGSRSRGLEPNRSSMQIRVVQVSATQVTFMTSQGSSIPFSGTWTIGAASDTATGIGGAALTDAAPDDLLQVGGELLTVQSITDNDTIVFTTNHVAGATAVTLHRDFGYEAYTAPTGTAPNVGLDPFNADAPTWNSAVQSLSGAPLVPVRGQPIQLYLSSNAGIPASVTGPLTGTHDVTAGSSTIAGTASLYTTELRPGSLFTTAGGRVVRIASVTSDTVATADRNFTATETGVTAERVNPPEIAGAGTITVAAASAAIVGVGTTFTAADIGTTITTLAGQQRTIVAVADALNATAAYPFTAAEAGVAYGFSVDAVFDLGAAQWAEVDHPGGVYRTQQGRVDAFVVDGSGIQFELGCLQELSLSLPGGRARTTGKGSFPCGVVPSGSDQGAELSITVSRDDESWQQATLEGEVLQLRILLETGLEIGTSGQTYHEWLICNGVLTNPTAAIPDAETNEIELTLELGENGAAPGGLPEDPGEPAFTTAITRVLYSAESDPFATTTP